MACTLKRYNQQTLQNYNWNLVSNTLQYELSFPLLRKKLNTIGTPNMTIILVNWKAFWKWAIMTGSIKLPHLPLCTVSEKLDKIWTKYYLAHTIIVQGKRLQVNEIANRCRKIFNEIICKIGQDNKLWELWEVMVGLLISRSTKTEQATRIISK